MAYTIHTSTGNIAAIVNDGTINTDTSLKLIGKGVTGYGPVIEENMIAMLENFAGVNPPLKPLRGQLWYDAANHIMNVYDGLRFKAVNNARISATQPLNAGIGDLWYDSDNNQLKTYDGVVWFPLAPIYERSQDISGWVVKTINDQYNTKQHAVAEMWANGQLIAVVSWEEFLPQPAYNNLIHIRPGINLVYPDTALWGKASYAMIAQGLEPSTDATYMRANADAQTVGNIISTSDFGITLGSDLCLNINSLNLTTNINSQKQLTINTPEGGYLIVDNAYPYIGINANNPGADPTVSLEVGGKVFAQSMQALQGITFGYAGSTGFQGSFNSNVATQLQTKFNGHNVSVITGQGDLSLNNNIAVKGTTLLGGPVVAPAGIHLMPNPGSAQDAVNLVTMNAMLPVGSVIMWYGSTANIPDGWHICDGTNGTPDLRDRFPYGAGFSKIPGDQGGNVIVHQFTNVSPAHTHFATTDVIPNHVHAVSFPAQTDGHALTVAEMPAHRHIDPYSENGSPFPQVPGTYGAPGSASTDFDQNFYFTGYTGGSGGDGYYTPGVTQPHSHTLTAAGNTNPGGSHYHYFETNPGGIHAHDYAIDVTPAYTALYFIMRIAYSGRFAQ